MSLFATLFVNLFILSQAATPENNNSSIIQEVLNAKAPNLVVRVSTKITVIGTIANFTVGIAVNEN
jgi:hypothetical protein